MRRGAKGTIAAGWELRLANRSFFTAGFLERTARIVDALTWSPVLRLVLSDSTEGPPRAGVALPGACDFEFGLYARER